MPSSRRSSQPRDQTRVSCLVGGFYTTEPLGKPILIYRLIGFGGLVDRAVGAALAVLRRRSRLDLSGTS